MVCLLPYQSYRLYAFLGTHAPQIWATASQKLLVQEAHEPVLIHHEHREMLMFSVLRALPHLSVTSCGDGGVVTLNWILQFVSIFGCLKIIKVTAHYIPSYVRMVLRIVLVMNL